MKLLIDMKNFKNAQVCIYSLALMKNLHLFIPHFFSGGGVEKTLNPFNVNSDLHLKYYLKN